MKDPIAPQMHELLPELFNKTNREFKPGGMCTPGSGCGPAVSDSTTDLLKMLSGSIPTPPASQEGAGNPTELHSEKEGARVLGPSGNPFTEDNIGQATAIRELLSELRGAGEITGGPAALTQRDRSRFLQQLDEVILSIRLQS